MTALHHFINESNDLEGLRELLNAGGNPNGQDRRGRTPLHVAVLKCEKNPQDTDELLLVCIELIRFGANVNQGNNLGRTPLLIAVGFRNQKMIKMLLQQKSAINHQDNVGFAALHFATTRRRFRRNLVLYDLDVGVVKLLLKYNPEVDIQSLNNETPLMLAIRCNNFHVVRELLKKKSSGIVQDINGNCAMHYALRRPELNVNIVRELMMHGCSFDVVSHNGVTPMALYFRRLKDAPLTEVEKATYVIKLYVFYANGIHNLSLRDLRHFTKRERRKLSEFITLCVREIEQMRDDSLAANRSVYDIAVRGAFYRLDEDVDHIPTEVFDTILDKLVERQYPIYCDMIAAGICSPYISNKVAENWSNIITGNKRVIFDELYLISSYVSHFDMLNMMIAASEQWLPPVSEPDPIPDSRNNWFLPRCTFRTSYCVVS